MKYKIMFLKYGGFIAPVLYLILSIFYAFFGIQMHIATPVIMSILWLLAQSNVLDYMKIIEMLEMVADGNRWVPCEESLPPDEFPVLIRINGKIRIGERRWDHPGFEDTYQSYWYWDDPDDDGQAWERDSVTHWKYIND